MLIECNITNYRSLKESNKFSLVATKENTLQDTNCMLSGITAIPQLLRTAALYGANASGKSNLITAFAFMRSMVETSAVNIREGQHLNVAPFRFNQETTQQPSEFEIIFVESGVRYQYGFSLTTMRVVKEWLYVCKKAKAQCWFERVYNPKDNQDHCYFGPHLLGGKQLHQLWKESTRANALLLSTAVNLNSEQLRPIFNWFVNKLVVIDNSTNLFPFYTIECIRNELNKKEVMEFLQAADLGITDVQIKMQKGQQVQFRLESGGAAIENKMADIPTVTFYHQNDNNQEISFDISEESHGTQRLFSYTGPIIDILQQGKTLVIDELDNSLHPKLVRFLIGLFQNPKINQHNAQLIFTTHNTSLLDNTLFRRDQIWFMEKDRAQASHLYPLTDFSPRKDEALEKGYLLGRYGALPFFGEFHL